VLVGASVTETIRSGITDTSYFVDIPAVFMLGMFCALIGAGAWVLIATRLALPVSTTHAISMRPCAAPLVQCRAATVLTQPPALFPSSVCPAVGAIIGFTVVAAGWAAVDWIEVALIVVSWFLSPALSGTIAATGFYLVRRFILRSPNSLERGFKFYPLLISVTFAVNVFFVLYKGIPGFDMEDVIGIGYVRPAR